MIAWNDLPAWRNGIRVCLKNRFSQGIVGSSPTTGILRLPLSIDVFPVLHRPSEIPPLSLWIACYLPCLLSVLLASAACEDAIEAGGKTRVRVSQL